MTYYAERDLKARFKRQRQLWAKRIVELAVAVAKARAVSKEGFTQMNLTIIVENLQALEEEMLNEKG